LRHRTSPLLGTLAVVAWRAKWLQIAHFVKPTALRYWPDVVYYVCLPAACCTHWVLLEERSPELAPHDTPVALVLLALGKWLACALVVQRCPVLACDVCHSSCSANHFKVALPARPGCLDVQVLGNDVQPFICLAAAVNHSALCVQLSFRVCPRVFFL
jgi:hypothetical protein